MTARLLLLAGHTRLTHLLVCHLGISGQRVGRCRRRTLHLLVERTTGHLLLLLWLIRLLLILAGLTRLLLLVRVLLLLLLQLVLELVLLLLLLLLLVLLLLLLSGLLLVLFVLVGITQRQTNRTVLPLAVFPVIDDLP